MVGFYRLVLLLICFHSLAYGQDRWGVGLSTGLQNFWRPLQEGPPRALPVPVSISAGRVFMLKQPELALWFYARAEGTGKNQAFGVGYRVYSGSGFGERGSLKAFADLFLSTPYMNDRVGPPLRERSSGTFFSVGLSHFISDNHSIEISAGLYTTRQYQDRSFAIQPAIGYSFIPNPNRALRPRKIRRFRNPTRCPESFR